jgi:transcriptional regulator with XRE-family HTH domain
VASAAVVICILYRIQRKQVFQFRTARTSMPRVSFLDVLAKYFRRSGLAKAEIARRLGVSRGQVGNVLAGARVIVPGEAAAWAKALDLSDAERDRFVEAVELEHAPARLAQRYLAMKAEMDRKNAELERLRAEVGRLAERD